MNCYWIHFPIGYDISTYIVFKELGLILLKKTLG